MRLRRIIPIIALSGAVALVACDDDPTGIQISDFAGSWTASVVQYTAHADASRQLDIVSVGGGLTLVVGSDGTYSGTFTHPQLGTIPITGSVTLVSDTEADIVFNWPEAVTTPPITDFRAEFELQGDNLTFSRPSTVFHFPSQEAPEAASLVIIMSR